MSALARYFHAKGVKVSGYDKTGSTLSRKLEAEGINVIYSEKVGMLPSEILTDRNSLIVYTPAIPGDHPQLSYFRTEAYSLEKRASVLGRITRDKFTLAVAGTHGKTTTTAMLAHLLKESGAEVTAFLGGESENYKSNLILAGDKVMVVEADEFDRSFLQLSLNIAAITSMDADHLDIYGENEMLQQSFREFAALVPEDGSLFYKNGLPLLGVSVGIEDGADITAENVRVENGSYLFDLKVRTDIFKGFRLTYPGQHNLLNAVTALAMAIEFGCPPNKISVALAEFKGVHRRFSYRIKTEELILIDDYAHHPAEISAVHQAVREMHPEKKICVVFQPHLFSRTRDFADEFAESLGLFDEILLLDIYPAREKPMEGITAGWLLEKIKNPQKQLVQKQGLSQVIKNCNPEVVILLGAGDIGEEVEKIKRDLSDEN